MFGRVKRSITTTPWNDPRDPWGGWPGVPYGPTAAGVNVDSGNATQLLAVYGSTRMITDAGSTLPLGVFRKKPDGSSEPLTPPSWWDEPSPGLNMVAWLSQVFTSLLLDGNSYLLPIRGGDGRLQYLIPLAAAAVRLQPADTLPGARAVYYVNGKLATFPIVHIPGIMRAGALEGMSPVEAARQSIGAGMAVQDFAGRFFGQGATMAGVITMPGQMPAEGPGSPREMAKAFARAHSGTRKAHLPAVLQGGATWQATGVTNEQAQFLQTRGFSAAEIAGQMFLLDPSDLGIAVQGTSLTYANLEQRDTRRLRVAILPWLVRIENALSTLFARPQYVRFDTDEYVRGDLATQFAVFQIGIRNRIYSPDEIRTKLNMSPIPDGTGADFYGPMAPGKPEPHEPAVDAGADFAGGPP